MTEMDDILQVVPSTEPATFSEFLRGLKDAPERGDKAEWSILFRQLERLEADGLVEIERSGNKIDTLILTEAGAARARGR